MCKWLRKYLQKGRIRPFWPDPSFLARSGKNGHGSEALQLWVQQLILTHALKKFIKMGGIPNSALANKNEINSAAANIMKLILFSSTFAIN